MTALARRRARRVTARSISWPRSRERPLDALDEGAEVRIVRARDTSARRGGSSSTTTCAAARRTCRRRLAQLVADLADRARAPAEPRASAGAGSRRPRPRAAPRPAPSPPRPRSARRAPSRVRSSWRRSASGSSLCSSIGSASVLLVAVDADDHLLARLDLRPCACTPRPRSPAGRSPARSPRPRRRPRPRARSARARAASSSSVSASMK